MKRRIFNTNSNLGRERLCISLIMLVLLTTLSISYASYQEELESVSEVTILAEGLIEVDNAYNASSSVSGTISSYKTERTSSGANILFNTTSVITSTSDNYITYEITLKNNSNKSYTYNGLSDAGTTDPSITLNMPRLLGLVKGDIIASGESKTIKLIYYYEGSITEDILLERNAIFAFLSGEESVAEPSMSGVIDSSIFKLSSTETTASTTLNVSNNFDVSVKYIITSSNDEVTLINNEANILNTSTSEKSTITFSLANTLESSEIISTNLYIETENGESYLIDTVYFESEDTPTSLATVDIDIQSHTYYSYNDVLNEYFNLYFNVTNDTEDTLEEFSIKIKFKDDTNITSIYYYGAGIGIWDLDTMTYTINGTNPNITYDDGTHPYITITAGNTSSFGLLRLSTTSPTGESLELTDYIDYVIIVNGASQLDEGDSQCDGSSTSELVCTRGYNEG